MFASLTKFGTGSGVGFLLGLLAVWWVDPTTNGGAALLVGVGVVLGTTIGAITSLLFRQTEEAGNGDG